jgi:hypothetical protein
LDDKEYEESLKAVIDINTNVETHPDVNKGPMMCALQADINSVYGQALLALGKNEESITRHKKELAAAKKSGITDLKVRAMDNLAVSKFDLFYKLVFLDFSFFINLYNRNVILNRTKLKSSISSHLYLTTSRVPSVLLLSSRRSASSPFNLICCAVLGSASFSLIFPFFLSFFHNP